MRDSRRQKDEYQTLSTVHEESDHDDSSSSTDVDLEALDLNEKDYLHDSGMDGEQRGERKSGLLAILKEYWWLGNTFLLMVIIVLLLDGPSHGRKHYFEGAGDITGFAPEFSQKITTFSPDPGFVPENTSEFFTDETRQKWLGLVPSKSYNIPTYIADSYHSIEVVDTTMASTNTY